jgi:hypothetical protein
MATGDTQDVRRLAQDLVDEYGWSALDDRMRVMEWLDGRGLLSDAEDLRTREREDSDIADAVELRMRWLLEE